MTGFVVLRRGGLTPRIPFWTLDRASPARRPDQDARHTRGGTPVTPRRGKARVSSYRYPDNPAGVGVSNDLPGPEQVFRVRIGSRVANFGVRVVGQGKGVVVTPRIVAAGDENRLANVPALPLDVYPYRDSYGALLAPVSAALVPARGLYDVVFDTRSRTVAGPVQLPTLAQRCDAAALAHSARPQSPGTAAWSCRSSTVAQASTHGRSTRSLTEDD